MKVGLRGSEILLSRQKKAYCCGVADSKRLKEVHRPDGKLVTFEYKPQSDRLTRIVSPRGNTDFDYDETTGFVAEIEEPDGQKLSFEYEGLLLKRTTWTGEVNGSVGRTYDENFRV